jgi:regulator of sirC expression with transglutaminase-like and TPR domain
VDPSLRELADLVGTAQGIDLARGALLIARIEYPSLDVAEQTARLDALAARSAAASIADPRARLERLRRFLFQEESFRGNADDYYDPRNSCLNQVLARRLGIPITLSVLTMEVGRRVGLAIHGVGLPGHFVVRADVEGDTVLLDPFDAGATVGRERAAAIVSRVVGREVELRDEHFAAVTNRQILARMLMNLQGIYVRGEAWDKALAVLDRLPLVDAAGAADHQRHRGAILLKLGRLADAASTFDRYLSRYPDAPDTADIRRQLRAIRQAMASRN